MIVKEIVDKVSHFFSILLETTTQNIRKEINQSSFSFLSMQSKWLSIQTQKI